MPFTPRHPRRESCGESLDYQLGDALDRRGPPVLLFLVAVGIVALAVAHGPVDYDFSSVAQSMSGVVGKSCALEAGRTGEPALKIRVKHP